jgi:hypothetical protein
MLSVCSIDQAVGLVQRLAHRLSLIFRQVDDGLQPVGRFAESADQVGEEFAFHGCGLSPDISCKNLSSIAYAPHPQLDTPKVLPLASLIFSKAAFPEQQWLTAAAR